MKLEGTPDEVLALLANLADRVAHPTPPPEPSGTVAARVLERAERDAAIARAEAAEAELDRLRTLEALNDRAAGIGRWPEPGEVNLDLGGPPDWIRVWCAAHPIALDPDHPAPEPGGVAPLHDDGTEVALPDVLVRLKTPAERAEYDAQETARLEAAADARAAHHAAKREARAEADARKPKGVGDPGANVGDGLDVWRVDGRALYQQARSAALQRGATATEARAVSAYTPLDYARLAAAVEEARAAGARHPLSVIAERLGRSGPGAIDQALGRAVALGILTEGKFSGGTPSPRELTDHGRALLAAANDDTPDETDPELEAKELATLVEPTPEQQAAIDALNREGQGIVDRLRRGTYQGPRAEIPAGMNPVKNSSIPKALRRAATEARYQGWAIARGKGGHLHWIAPDGRRVVTSSTPGGHPTADLRDLKAAGVPG